MSFNRSLYTQTPKPHDESRFEYHAASITFEIMTDHELQEAR
jgi:hypothetical protein